MIPHKMHGLVAASALLMSSAGLTWAQQKIEEAGTDFVVRDNHLSELEEGHIVVLVNTKGITMTDDASHPLNMTAVDCKGIFDEFSDGSYKGNGYCIGTDREGHKLISRWSENSDTAESRYEVTGGTGKFEGAKGEGTSTLTEVSPGRRVGTSCGGRARRSTRTSGSRSLPQEQRRRPRHAGGRPTRGAGHEPALPNGKTAAVAPRPRPGSGPTGAAADRDEVGAGRVGSAAASAAVLLSGLLGRSHLSGRGGRLPHNATPS
jgi:hypothetical protein